MQADATKEPSAAGRSAPTNGDEQNNRSELARHLLKAERSRREARRNFERRDSGE
jgi:hypothetical protein